MKSKAIERQPSNQEELRNVLEEEWWAIPQPLIRNLINGDLWGD